MMTETNMCRECGKAPILCQGHCVECRKVDERNYRESKGLLKTQLEVNPTAVGYTHGSKTHLLVAQVVVWGGVKTRRWVAKCAVSSRAYGSPIKDAEVTCKRCS